MTAIRLRPRAVERIWGRTDLPPWTAATAPGDRPVGEIWYEDPRGGDAPLLLKYLFTSQALSVQVHPDDDAARASGLARGKDEAWLVLAAGDGARIGIGLTRVLSRDELRGAALDGSIEALIDWRAVAAGDMIHVPAGTIHALGPGLDLLEVQQNTDVTYRLYDYGRDRPLQVEAAVAVADARPYREPIVRATGEGRLDGRALSIERWRGERRATLAARRDHPVWVVPLADGSTLDGETIGRGSVWLIEESARLVMPAGGDVALARARI